MYSNLFSVFKKILSLCIIELEEFFMFSLYKFFMKHLVCKYFFPVCGLFFHFLNGIFWRGNFSLIMSPFIVFFFMDCIFGIISKKSLLDKRSQKLSFMSYSRIFRALALIFWINFCVQIYLLTYGYSVVSTLLVDKPAPYSLNCLDIFVKNQLTEVRVYFCLFRCTDWYVYL